MTVRTYASPQAFKQALEQRLRDASKNGADFARKRQLLVFDRFLARIVAVMGDAVLLKGVLVLELRLERARTTKDIDLRLDGLPDNVLARLQEAGRQDLGDFMAFEVNRDAEQPKIQNDGMQYEGLRFRALCRLAGKQYGQHFGVDVAFGEPILGEPAIATAEDILGFAGIAPPVLRLYPIETHIAEKLHAYTMPRLREALEQTFVFRATHPLPQTLPAPPANWSASYAEMVRENDLPWTTLEQLVAVSRTFLDPVLAGKGGTWSPAAWAWE